MNDELPQIALLASAYLDGELDAAEARRAEGDPAVMAEVAQLRALRTGLRDVEPPSDAAREAALTAALGEFDLRHRPSTVVPYRPRPAYGRWLGVAAAVAAVGVLGVVISQASLGGGDDDAAEDAVVQSESEPATAEAAEVFEDDAFEDEAFDDDDAARATSDSAAAATMLAEAPAASLAPAATEPTAAGDGADAELAAEQTAAPAPVSAPIGDAAELTRTAQQLLELEAAGMLPPPPDTPCDDDAEAPLAVLGEGSMRVGDTVVPVLIAVDRATTRADALDPDTCAVLTTGANP